VSTNPAAAKFNRPVSWKLLCLAILASGHLVLTALGAFSFEFSDESRFGRVMSFYGEASGAGHSYGFFAPGVFSQIRAIFDITDKAGVKKSIDLESEISPIHEAQLRVGNIIEQFMNDYDDPMEYQRALAASLAGTVFGRHPEATSVNVRIERFTAQSLTEYKRGLVPKWIPEYSAEFVYKQPLAEK
jgi:hypothetical protein